MSLTSVAARESELSLSCLPDGTKALEACIAVHHALGLSRRIGYTASTTRLLPHTSNTEGSAAVLGDTTLPITRAGMLQRTPRANAPEGTAALVGQTWQGGVQEVRSLQDGPLLFA